MRAGRIEQCAPMDVMLAAPATPYVAALLERAIMSSSLTREPS
jgi:hypothetical protein